MCSEGEVLGDGLAEVVGDFVNEPSIELVAFSHRIWRGPLHPPVRIGNTLVCGFGASSVRIESDGVGGALLVGSCQWLVDRVVEAYGEGLAVLPAGDGDGG